MLRENPELLLELATAYVDKYMRYLRPCDRDDAVQEVVLSALKAPEYDADASALDTYFTWRARSAKSHMAKHANRLKRKGDTLSFDTPIDCKRGNVTLGDCLSSDDDYDNIFYADLMRACRRAKLPTQYVNYVLLVMRGYTQQEIADMYGVSKSSVSKMLSWYKERLREVLKSDD